MQDPVGSIGDNGGERLVLEIEKVVYRGAGLARAGGIVTFVPGTLPGERVIAETVATKKNFRTARLLEVLEPSPCRIPDVCAMPGGGIVPGCAYGFARYADEVEIKDGQLRDFLRSFGAGQGAVERPFASPVELGYRNKTVFHVGHAHGRPVAGYLGDDNRTIVDMASCPLSHREINGLWAEMRSETLSSHPLPRTVTLRRTEAGGAVAWTDIAPPAPALRLVEHSPVGDILVPADGFFQVNPHVAAPLVETVRDWVSEVAGNGGADIALDLFCGVGVFGLAVAGLGFGRVIGVETSRRAVKCARANAANLGLHTAEFHCMDASRFLAEKAGRLPMERAVAIADPPRAGMPREALDALLSSPLRHAVFVSCNPSTLARDISAAAKAGFAISRARLFDMFPRTIHFETAVLLERK